MAKDYTKYQVEVKIKRVIKNGIISTQNKTGIFLKE
jgi:hypothetical protein